MNSFKIWLLPLIVFHLILSNNFQWLVEIDCDKKLNFFEIRTLNTHNLDNCTAADSKCGEYINLSYYSVHNKNQIYHNICEIDERNLDFSLKPINMAGSVYDLTPYFSINLKIDNRIVVQDLPIYPSPLYDKILWGLKISSLRFNANLGSIEIIISDDEHYDQSSNNNKINAVTTWLWNSSYKSAFDPNWGGKWQSLTESDIWSIDKVHSK